LFREFLFAALGLVAEALLREGFRDSQFSKERKSALKKRKSVPAVSEG